MPGNIIYANANLDSNNLDIFRYDSLQEIINILIPKEKV